MHGCFRMRACVWKVRCMRMVISVRNHMDGIWLSIKYVKSRFKMDYPKVIPYYTEPEALALGATKIEINDLTFGIYDKERVICDCLKYEGKLEHEIFKEALQSYIKDEEKDISMLMEYARARKVVSKVQSLIGVWL